MKRGTAVRRLLALLALALVVLPRPALAQVPRVVVDVSMNGEPRGQRVIAAANDDVLMESSDLRDLQVPLHAARTREISGVPFVSLASLHDVLAYRLDLNHFRLDLTLDAHLLAHSTISLAPNAPEARRDRIRAAVLNYAVHAVPQQRLSADAAARYDTGAGVVESSFGRTTDGRWARGSTSYTLDDATALRRTIVGDTIGATGTSAAVLVGGVTIERAFSIDPYAVLFPLPSARTSVLTPSRAEIYVDGALVKTIDLPPGQYDLTNLPLRAGLAHADVVIRDAFGNANTAFDASLYEEPGLLRKGLSDYAYTVGAQRLNASAPGDRYGPIVAVARYRLGVTNRLTVGAHADSGNGISEAGAEIDTLAGDGGLHVAAAASDGIGRRGGALDIAYGSSGLSSALTVRARVQSAQYSTLGATQTAPTFSSFEAAVTRRITATTTLALDAAVSDVAGEGSQRRAAVSANRRFGSVALDAAISTVEGGRRSSTGFSVLLSRFVPGGASQSLDLSAQGTSPQLVAQTTKSARTPLDPSYSLFARNSGVPLSAQARIPWQYGVASLRLDPAQSQAMGSADLEGAVVKLSGVTLLAQPISDAFAVVQTDGTAGVDVFNDTLRVGKTNRWGYAVVSGLQAYQPSRLDVSDAALPLNHTIGSGEQVVAPAYHAGTLVAYASRVLHAVAGRILVAKSGRTRVPAYGEVRARKTDGTEAVSPVDADGRFYFDDLREGPYDLTVEDESGTCSMRITVRSSGGPITNLGTVTCAVSPAR